MEIKKLMFTASNCQACQVVKPFAEDNGFDIISLDTDNGLALANNYGVRGLPTIIIIDKNEDEALRKTGTLSSKEKQEIKDIINNED